MTNFEFVSKSSTHSSQHLAHPFVLEKDERIYIYDGWNEFVFKPTEQTYFYEAHTVKWGEHGRWAVFLVDEEKNELAIFVDGKFVETREWNVWYEQWSDHTGRWEKYASFTEVDDDELETTGYVFLHAGESRLKLFLGK